jgi:hypothetical protein
MLCPAYGFLSLVMLWVTTPYGRDFLLLLGAFKSMFFGGRKACGSKQGTEMAEQKHLSLSFFPDSNFVCFAFALKARRPQVRYLFPFIPPHPLRPGRMCWCCCAHLYSHVTCYFSGWLLRLRSCTRVIVLPRRNRCFMSS